MYLFESANSQIAVLLTTRNLTKHRNLFDSLSLISPPMLSLPLNSNGTRSFSLFNNLIILAVHDWLHFKSFWTLTI